MRAGREMICIAALAAAGAVGSAIWHPRAPSWYRVQAAPARDEVDAAQVRLRWPGGVLWLDARPRSAYEAAHIEGALPLGEANFDEDLLAILDVLQKAERPVIVYCDGLRCETSRRIRERLLQMVPIDECYILRGGYSAWQRQGRP
jgi:rhodanese-related sulfurtransferase